MNKGKTKNVAPCYFPLMIKPWGETMHRLACMYLCLIVFALHGMANDSPAPTGNFEAVFNQYHPLSTVREIIKRTGVKPKENQNWDHQYKLEEETFQVYVPKHYKPETQFGLLLWINAGDKGFIPKAFPTIMDKHNLIWIGADKSGNNENVAKRRIPLALDAVHNMNKRYNIDPKRIYVSGISGGGRVASMVALHYSDIFTGGIFVIGANYWNKMAVPSEPGKVWLPALPKPKPIFLTRARKYGRYVLLTGDNDFNREQMKAFYDHGYNRYLDHVLYLQVPEMGHQMCPPDWFEKSLLFLDDKEDKYPKQTYEPPKH